MAKLDPKVMCLHNSELALRTFGKFYLAKGTKKNMKIMLMIFLKKRSFGTNGLMGGPKIALSYNTGFTLKIFLKIFHSERGQ